MLHVPLQLLEYDQAEFVPEDAPNSFDDQGGFVYVPTECQSGGVSTNNHNIPHESASLQAREVKRESTLSCFPEKEDKRSKTAIFVRIKNSDFL